jgi:hypothetical protein
MTDKPIMLTPMNEFSIAAFKDGIKYVRLCPTEIVSIPIKLGEEVTFTLRVTSIDRTETL